MTELIVAVIYFAVLILIGIWTYRHADNSMEDFLLGGRTLGYIVIALTIQATAMSAYIFQSLPGQGYTGGLSNIWWPFTSLAGAVIAFTVLARRLRVFTQRSGSLTLTDFFSFRYYDGHGNGQAVRIVATIVTVVFMVAYVGAQFVATGTLFNYFFGISLPVGILLGAGIVMFYTLMGGFYAVAWTDVLQGAIMFVVLLTLPILLLLRIGGVESAASILSQQDPQLLTVQPVGFITWLGIMFIGIAYIGQPQLAVRYMAMRSTREAKQTLITIGIWGIFALYGAFFAGLLARVINPSIDNPELSLFVAIQEALPPTLVGIVIAAVLAAIMSTADSLLLVGASGISEDIYHKILRPDASDRQLVAVSRWTTAILCLLALLFAFTAEKIILTLLLYAFAGLSSAFAAPLVLGLFWKRTTRQGALAGMILGGLTVIVWRQVGLSWNPVYEAIPGWVVSFAATYIVSMLTPAPPLEIQELVERCKPSKIDQPLGATSS